MCVCACVSTGMYDYTNELIKAQVSVFNLSVEFKLRTKGAIEVVQGQYWG